jgi:hypothetical protein
MPAGVRSPPIAAVAPRPAAAVAQPLPSIDASVYRQTASAWNDPPVMTVRKKSGSTPVVATPMTRSQPLTAGLQQPVVVGGPFAGGRRPGGVLMYNMKCVNQVKQCPWRRLCHRRAAPVAVVRLWHPSPKTCVSLRIHSIHLYKGVRTLPPPIRLVRAQCRTCK